MIHAEKSLTASKDKTPPTSTTAVSAPPVGGGMIITEFRAAESPSPALWSKYIDSRMKQFGTR